MNQSAAKVILFFLLMLSISSSVSAEEILYARYPALSLDGTTIAFTYQGDIWTVPSSGGEAIRLTVHEAEDFLPHYSPDGKMILFSSDRFNNSDIFVMPAEGGTPRQLTFHSTRDVGSGWFPNSDSILFTSGRDGWKDIFKISIDGGTPVRLTGYPYEQEYNGRLTPDGKFLIYNNGSGNSRWWRRDLQGSRNADIYIQDRTNEIFTSRRLTDAITHEVWPILNHQTNEIYFASCRDEWGQIWKMPFAGGEAVQLTNFEGDGVQWLNSNPQGTKLVFEQGFHIWIMDPAQGQSQKVAIEIKTDEKDNLITQKTFNNKVDRFSLSPDGKKIAAVVHGEIFVLPSEDPEIGKRVTFTSARENYPVWGNDSKNIYYCSDRNGNYDIYSADVTTLEEKQLTQSPENDIKPIISPDGNFITFYRGLNQIIRLDIKSGKEEVWVEGSLMDLGVEPTIEYDISGDSKWLVFTMCGPTYETDIYAVNLDGEQYNLSRFAGWNYRPRFSKDGKLVYYTSSFNSKQETYKIDLVQKPVEFVESSFDSLFLEEDSEKKEDEDGEDSEKEIEPVIINIDGIEYRRTRAYNLPASSQSPVLSHDGKKYYFVSSLMGKPEIWSINTEDDPELKQLTHSGQGKSQLILNSDSKRLLFLEGGKIKQFEIDKDKVSDLAFSATMEIDTPKNLYQKFNETWQMLNVYFYDSTFHGTDWKAVRDKYEPALEHIRTEIEFRNFIKEIFGELRASHLNLYLNASGPTREFKSGRIGIEIDYDLLDSEGLYRIKKVLSESPADIAGIEVGQYISHINGVALSSDANFNKLLAGTENRRLTLSISEKPNDEGREINLKPVSESDLATLRYDNWVERRREMVDSLSDGRLAYMHIRSMDQPSLRKFEQELVSVAEHKEGLIIDVRNNFGGNIAVHLLGMLVKTPYVLRGFRGAEIISENKMRSKAHEKPMSLLINNYSTSNAEIFAEGFRTLKLGKIIGEPTAGGVIGTSSYYLIDGTRIRRPSTGAYSVDMEDTDIYRRQPDIMVENLPDDFINGRDPQLMKAVEELLGELE